jgi:pyruvate kinase
MLQVVLSGGGTAAQLISKYRPPCPILVVSDNEQVLRGLAGYYGIVPCKVRKEGEGVHD